MKEYKVYHYPESRHEAVKQGWSRPGFFRPTWAMIKEMWSLGGSVLVAVIVLAMFPVDSAIGALATLISFTIYLACGVNNCWREKNLKNRGYDHVDIVSASNSEGAVALYLKNLINLICTLMVVKNIKVVSLRNARCHFLVI
nr:hypothetical protein [Halomonas sp. 1513]